MSTREYIPGDTVFAKLKGYPWWPARVENDKDIPAKILKQKGKSKGVLYTVFFYGSRDYGFFGPDCVRPFDRATVERDLKAKKFKTKDLETAIHQALDPSILKAEEEAEAAAALEDDDEEEEEEEEEEEDKKKRTTKKKSVQKKKTSPKKKPVSRKRVIEETDEETDEKKMKQSDHEDRKKRRKSLSTEQEEEKKEETNQTGKISDLEAFKKTPEYKRVYHIRHKLQKLVYEKKPGEIQKEDFAKISQVVKEIEESKITFDLLRYTKIGKVVKFACSYDYGEDEFKINNRCQQLMRNWKSLILPEHRSSSVEQQS
ncbi:PWWP domain-containing protein2 [Choanephora cucurbitarum]|uniref:PWWP domain-containing protein2 n=1 Tax=Choanephora cucurbitarum TaxID=101091 RepID=A0A1C7NEF9_9FUNG|nr:PWWP domain-containing protein2 [Choanephora cucurbitarum]